MVVRSFEFDSLNISGNAIKVSCKASSSLSCEVTVEPLWKSKLRWLYYVMMAGMIAWILQNMWTSWNDGLVSHNWVATAITSLCIAGLWMKCSYFNAIKETVTIIKNIGIQIKTTYSSGRETSMFVDHKSIADIIINEGITMHQVIYYLAILQTPDETAKKASKSLIPLFMGHYPRFDAIKPVYHFIRSVLFDEEFDEAFIQSIQQHTKPTSVS